ncbi:response regulator transcription factor [Flaviaesturariibacter aridisoli]|uniref:Response regulator transcription factor n=1 Tax=Flaviaesturariibacter aridisoli TaxID=2545761 RepID=A0A4R4DVT3_9BACT|nr:response regulator transcription factor [Flaviaesturariibacter aridisoli]TCZ66300.1 response regulator transcription factor [Flaviaesturariibacter aridisoli]
MQILIIEDESSLAQSMCDYLAQENFTCQRAHDFATGLRAIDDRTFDCIVLDINLPGGSGLSLLRTLKEERRSEGVLIISAKGLLEDRLLGLHTGADDYLVKPFHLAELGARVAAIIRRKAHDGQKRLLFGLLELDLEAHTAFAGGTTLELTRKEYDLLLYLISNRNRVINKNALGIHLWGEQADVLGSYDFIYTHIKNLRRKLSAAGAPDYIQSVYGIGYKCALP